MFQWAKAVFAIDEEETLRVAGMDSYVFLRFLLLCFKITAASAVLCILILIPVYKTGGNGEIAYNSITMANVKDGSGRLWAPLIFWYLFVGWVLYLMWKEWENFVPKRYHFLAEGDEDTPDDYRYTMLVESIPEGKRTTPALLQYFQDLFPGQVVDASVCTLTPELDELLKTRQAAIEAVEQANAKKMYKPDGPEPTSKVGAKLGICGGKKVETIPYYTPEIERLNEECEALLVKTHADLQRSGEEELSSSTGFVTFKSLAAKMAAVQVQLTGRSKELEAFPAPEPSDMLWDNVTSPLLLQKVKKMTANALWSLGILFWAIPVAFVQAIANLDSILKSIGLGSINTDGALYGIIAGYLPVIALMVLMIVLPIVIQLSAVHYIRLKSNSLVDDYTIRWHFGFQVANLWLVVIGGSLFNQLDAILDDPTSIIELLARALPEASQFFLGITIISTFAGLPMELSQIGPVVVKWALGKVVPREGQSQRQLDNSLQPVPLRWGVIYPPVIFSALVGIVYSPIVPFIQPFTAIYFGLAFLVYKNQYLHVYGNPYEGGGGQWFFVYRTLMICLYIAEGILIVYLGLKKAVVQAPCAFVPLVVSILFDIKVGQEFRHPCRVLSLEVARDTDKRMQKYDDIMSLASVEQPLIGSQAPAAGSPGPGSINSGYYTATGVEVVPEGEHIYLQPSLRKGGWDTKPQPYRRKEGQSLAAKAGDDGETKDNQV
ncbi:unnamed protein product [Chrysoparadoxa australica]